jgi:tRNA (cmo5U34)-methyltransferase
MFKKSQETFEGITNVTITNEDVTQDYKFKNASLITSILTVQFIQEKDRQLLINNIYEGLNKGSAFIMVEKVVGSNARFNEIWTELYHELKLKNGLSEEHVFSKSRAIRGVMKPYTVNENIHMLEEAGFKDTDIFFKWNNFVGFIAVK